MLATPEVLDVLEQMVVRSGMPLVQVRKLNAIILCEILFFFYPFMTGTFRIY